MDNQDRIVRYRFTKYLLTAIKNHVYRYQRKNTKRANYEKLVEDLDTLKTDSQYDSYFESMPFDFDNEILDKAMRELKKSEASIIYLHLVEGYSLKEAAIVLNLNYSYTRALYARAMNFLRKKLEEGE